MIWIVYLREVSITFLIIACHFRFVAIGLPLSFLIDSQMGIYNLVKYFFNIILFYLL